MKTQKMNYGKLTSRLLFAVTLLIIAACKGRQESDGSQETVKPPSMDIHAAAFMGNVQAIHQHIKAGTDLNKKDDYGSTPLITATLFGKTEAAFALIEGGADVNLRNNDGSTPLHTAAFFCRTAIVRVLLKNGADKSLKNNYGSTALESVSVPFDEIKAIYDQIGKDLGPLGLKLDYKRLESERPLIADMLR
jgi:hypothetical protein